MSPVVRFLRDGFAILTGRALRADSRVADSCSMRRLRRFISADFAVLSLLARSAASDMMFFGWRDFYIHHIHADFFELNFNDSDFRIRSPGSGLRFDETHRGCGHATAAAGARDDGDLTKRIHGALQRGASAAQSNVAFVWHETVRADRRTGTKILFCAGFFHFRCQRFAALLRSSSNARQPQSSRANQTTKYSQNSAFCVLMAS